MSNADVKLELLRAYRALFLNEDGSLKAEGELILRDLEKECGWMVEGMPIAPNGHVDPMRLAGNYAKRGIYAHIKKRIFDPLLAIKRQTETE